MNNTDETLREEIRKIFDKGICEQLASVDCVECEVSDNDYWNCVTKQILLKVQPILSARVELAKQEDCLSNKQDTEIRKSVIEYVESIFPELREVYWESPRWKQFKKEQLLEG